MEIEEAISFGLLVAVLIEQVFYWFPGSFPYRHGFLIKTIPTDISMSDWTALQQERGRLAIKINDGKKEVYLRYRYPFGVLGPLLFVGQIVYNSTGILKIRVGYFSAVFFSFISIISIWQLFLGPWQAANSLILLALIALFYLRFWRSYRNITGAS